MVQLQAEVKPVYIPCPSCGKPGIHHALVCPYSLAASGTLNVFVKELPKP